jgi:hypothetical protein
MEVCDLMFCRSLLIAFRSFCDCVGDVEMGKVLCLMALACQLCNNY